MILAKQMQCCVLDNFSSKSLHYKFNIQYYDYFKNEKNYIEFTFIHVNNSKYDWIVSFKNIKKHYLLQY